MKDTKVLAFLIGISIMFTLGFVTGFYNAPHTEVVSSVIVHDTFTVFVPDSHFIGPPAPKKQKVKPTSIVKDSFTLAFYQEYDSIPGDRQAIVWNEFQQEISVYWADGTVQQFNPELSIILDNNDPEVCVWVWRSGEFEYRVEKIGNKHMGYTPYGLPFELTPFHFTGVHTTTVLDSVGSKLVFPNGIWE